MESSNGPWLHLPSVRTDSSCAARRACRRTRPVRRAVDPEENAQQKSDLEIQVAF